MEMTDVCFAPDPHDERGRRTSAQRRTPDVPRRRRCRAAGTGAAVQPDVARARAVLPPTPGSTRVRCCRPGVCRTTAIAGLDRLGSGQASRLIRCHTGRRCRRSSVSTPIPTTKRASRAARSRVPSPRAIASCSSWRRTAITARYPTISLLARRSSTAAEPRCSASAEVLGIERVEWLGYTDSGMTGWEQNAEPSSFHQADVDEAARRLVDHPRGGVGRRADRSTTGTACTAIPTMSRCTVSASAPARWCRASGCSQSTFNRTAFVQTMAAGDRGRRTRRWRPTEDFDPDGPADDGNPFGTPEAEITLEVDVADFADLKRAALRCHRSQVTDTSFFLEMPDRAVPSGVRHRVVHRGTASTHRCARLAVRHPVIDAVVPRPDCLRHETARPGLPDGALAAPRRAARPMTRATAGSTRDADVTVHPADDAGPDHRRRPPRPHRRPRHARRPRRRHRTDLDHVDAAARPTPAADAVDPTRSSSRWC